MKKRRMATSTHLRAAEENNAGIVTTFLKRTLDPANKRTGGKEATVQGCN